MEAADSAMVVLVTEVASVVADLVIRAGMEAEVGMDMATVMVEAMDTMEALAGQDMAGATAGHMIMDSTMARMGILMIAMAQATVTMMLTAVLSAGRNSYAWPTTFNIPCAKA